MPSKIEWTQETWNPITGCSPVSEGCRNCFAKRMARRLAGRYGYPEAPHHFDVTLRPDRLDIPLRRKKPTTYFVCSMSDIFHKDIPTWFYSKIWQVVRETPRHTYLILTKRADIMYSCLKHINPLPNVHLGVSVENQDAADRRIPILARIPAAVRFVSLEPMLGPVDLSPQHADDTVFAPLGEERFIDCGGCVGTPGSAARAGGLQPTCPGHEAGGIDWAICGGESGPGARPMKPDWVRGIRDQCQAAGVPFFFKSHGAWLHESQFLEPVTIHTPGVVTFEERSFPTHQWADGTQSYRVGKKAAGRLLDGREWNETPRPICPDCDGSGYVSDYRGGGEPRGCK